jgi:hypothetical protein
MKSSCEVGNKFQAQQKQSPSSKTEQSQIFQTEVLRQT